MPRSAPAIDRAVALLDFMSSHQHETFSLSELARTLRFNKATCHSMCSALERHGVLIRNPIEKTYSLGPTLLRFASAVAPEGREALEIARPEMAELAHELSLTVVAAVLVGDQVTVLATRFPLGGGTGPQVGHQVTWLPPIGPTFAAWAPARVAKKWLGRIDHSKSPHTPSYFEHVLRELRVRGYDIGWDSDPRTQILSTIQSLEGLVEAEHIKDMLSDLMTKFETEPYKSANQEKRNVNNITAPVFGIDGQVVLTMTLRDFKRPQSAAEVERLATRLLNSTERVTKSIHGRLPEDWPQGD